MTHEPRAGFSGQTCATCGRTLTLDGRHTEDNGMTAYQHSAASLTQEALADRLTMLADDVRTFGVEHRDALLREAAQRLIVGARQLAEAYALIDTR